MVLSAYKGGRTIRDIMQAFSIPAPVYKILNFLTNTKSDEINNPV